MRILAVCRLIGACGVVAFCLSVTPLAQAQLPATKLSAIFPPGAKAGTTIDLTLTSGVELEEISRLLFNHPGITATPKMQDVGGQPTPIPNQFAVTVAPEVPPGNYEVRAVGFFGISNPRFFVVGSQPEVVEVEPNNTREQATTLEQDVVANGRVNGGADVDWFKFKATARQRLLITCVAHRLDSRLDGALEVYNTAGKRLEFARKNIPGLDPMIDIAIPADGDYFLKLYDFTYGGGEDYPYRLTISTAPYLDFILPAAGPPGSNNEYTVYGRNLPGGQPAGIASRGRPLEKLRVNIPLPTTSDLLVPRINLEPYSSGIDGVPFALSSSSGPSNELLVQFSSSAPTLEVEPNDKPAQAQKIAVPGEVDGQFQARNDVDCYRFDATAKQAFWIEVIAHRAGVSIDPVLAIDQVKTNEKGEETLTRISALDDDTSNPLANLFDTLSDDNAVKFAAPADGTFQITLRERFGNSKQDLGVYRLIVRPETPDFRAVAVAVPLAAPGQRQAAPSGITLRRGDNYPVNVVVMRKDGFAGPVTISAEGLPPGVVCRDISVGTTPSSGVLVFSSAEDAPAWAGTIQLIAKAIVDDPGAAERLLAAQAAEKAAIDAVATADKALTKPAEDRLKANEALEAAKKELAAQPDNEDLKKKVADTDAKLTVADAALKPLAEAKAAAEQKANEAKAAVIQAEQAKVAAARQVTHPVRSGTVIWSAPAPNLPGDARVTQSLELSVIEEASPYQLSTDVHRVEVNHNRQILIPIKVIRREGFDQPVNLTVVGQPQNAQVENKPIPKEKADELLRFFIPPNAPVGTYVTYLAGQAQVSYRKNPARAERTKAELMAAEQAANAAAEALKNGTTARDAAVKKAADDAANFKKLTEARQQADKVVSDAQAAEKAAADEVKNAAENADAKAAAEKKLADAQSATKTAVDAQTAAEKARAEAETTAKAAEDAKVKSEADLKLADDHNKAAIAAKAAAEQRFKAADGYAKANNIQFHPPSTPIVITVKPAPYTLTANVPNGGNVKAGEKLEIKCDVKRQNGFAGPVTLTLPLPPNVSGIKADPVVINPDQNSGTLVVEAAADAPEAQLANMVVRAVAQWDGEAAVDHPVALKVVK